MVIYGTRATGIGSFEIGGTKCKHCDTTAPQDVHVFGRYAHVFWIPLFPIGKVAVAECTHCKKTIKKKEFPNSLREQFNRVAKNYVKRPIWHWAGAMLIGALVLFLGAIDMTTTPDPRAEKLSADVEMMTGSPTMETDSTSFMIKTLFDFSIAEEMEPENFEYLTKVNGDKMLILVKIPTLKDLKKSERPEAANMIRELIQDSPFSDKELYIGIHGKYNMMVVETPEGKHNSSMALDDPLYEFYGPKPEKEE